MFRYYVGTHGSFFHFKPIRQKSYIGTYLQTEADHAMSSKTLPEVNSTSMMCVFRKLYRLISYHVLS